MSIGALQLWIQSISGGLAALGSISAVVAALTFILAMRRDRAQRLLQIELSRLEELRSALASYIETGNESARKHKILDAIEEKAISSEKYIDIHLSFAALEAKHLSNAARIRILVDVSDQSKISSEFVAAIENPTNPDRVLRNAQAYVGAEWKRIIRGKRATVGSVKT